MRRLLLRAKCLCVLILFLLGFVVPLYSTLSELCPWVLQQLRTDYGYWWRAVRDVVRAMWVGRQV